MKVNFEKVDVIIIQDENGSIVERFELGSASISTMGKGNGILTLKKAKKK